ncbi:hypothetical protein [Synechococcus sp. H65.1]|uniref:hypothetical protein n=1 Tax=unclassified Synechococcus TaxID=2626047 RepID=UPI0039C4098F
MITAEPISAEEFHQILAADLEACCEAFGLRAEYLRLQQQQLRFWVMLALCLLVIALVILLGARDPGYWLLYAVAVLLLGVVFLGLLWALLELRQNLQRIRQRWKEAHLLNSPAKIMEFASDLACKVKEYNHWVQELQQSLEEGRYWQDFRQLSEAEKQYIQSLLLQVRAQLITALQMCRALMENPGASVEQYFRQVVSRDQQLLEQFIAKNLTANRYAAIARQLSALEADLQTRISALAFR